MNFRAPINRTVSTSSHRNLQFSICNFQFSIPKPGQTVLPTLAILAATLSGCGQRPNQSQGVELVMSSGPPSPAMTFEVRFEQAMANASQVGMAFANSPLVITPPVAGTFTWLSARSGVFTPSEPLTLDTRYELKLRPGLAGAEGQPSRAKLRYAFVTPPFGVGAAWPQQASSNATSEPEIRLAFNADVRAGQAQPRLYFRDAAGERIPADVRQGLAEEAPPSYEFSGGQALMTWEEEFAAISDSGQTEAARHRRQAGNLSYGDGAEQGRQAGSLSHAVGNLLVVTPRRPLPLGKRWSLVLEAGIPGLDPSLLMRQRTEVLVGDITPFVVSDITAKNIIGSGGSIRLVFSKPIPESLTNNFGDWLKVSPRPTNLAVDVDGPALTLAGAFKGETIYTLKLRRDFRSTEPFTLKGSNTFKLKMPPVAPRLYFPAFSRDQLAGGNRSFPLLAVNVPAVRVRAKLLDPQTAVHALRGYASYFLSSRERRETGDWSEPYRTVDYNLVPGRTVFDQVLNLAPEPDAAKRLDLKWDQMLQGRKAGVVFLDARRAGADAEQSPALGTQALVQLTDLGLVWKTAATGVDVFVFSHGAGQPISGAITRLFSDENESLREAVTDASGRAHLESATNAEWVAVQQGEDFHAVRLEENRASLYGFELPYTGSEGPQDARRVLLFGDRNLYRPGEEMHLEALARDWSEQGLCVPAGLGGVLRCVDARGRRFFQTNASFSSSGSWSAQVPLPIGSRGTYSAQLRIGSNDYAYPFQVQDFQPSAFEIALPCKAAFCAGENISLSLSARYLFGKALSRAQVKWSLEAADMEFKPEGFEGFNFRRASLEARFGRGAASMTQTGQGVLLASTNFIIAPEVPVNPAAPQPRSVSLLAEVTDLNQQTLSRRIEFIRHSSDFYLGLRQGATMLKAGSALPLEVVAVRADGQPWPETVKAQLTLQRIEWQTVRLQGAGRTVRYHTEPVLSNVLAQAIEVPPIQMPAQQGNDVKGNRLADLPALPAGDYLLEAKAEDAAGHPVVSSLSFAVSAASEASWSYRNDVQLTLKPDQKLYAPGEAAEILVESPFSGTAMVSVEREKVLRSFVTHLEGHAPSVRVPLQSGDVPNVFVSVTLVRGADDCPHRMKEPEYRIGYCQLEVAEPQSRLAVAVAPAATNYLPAETVEVTVQVSGADGRAESGAEVVLYAVDDGILGLSDYGLPDPHSFFYSPRPLAVASSVSLPNLLTEDSDEQRFENKGYLGGGGGSERVRKDFLACAFWNATLRTGAEGTATARFPAPDSLTRYRVFAVAHSGSSRFGRGQAAFQVSKPLVLEPALPAFANLTDHLLARALIQNQTANAGEVVVSLTLDDKAKASEPDLRSSRRAEAPTGLLDVKTRADEPDLLVKTLVTAPTPSLTSQHPYCNLTRRVSVPANGSAVVEFPVEFTEVGEAKWLWRAHFAEPEASHFTDAVQSQIEVGHIAPLLHEVLLGHVNESQSNLLAGANPQLLAGAGTVTVNIANTRLNELGEAVAQLLHYPYGCAEQTGSSLLPWIVLREAPSLLPLLGCRAKDIDGAIRAGVARLFTMQTHSGGLGYWPRAAEPMLWASAYGGMVLALAQRHGIEVPKEDFGLLLNYLSQSLRATGAARSELSDCCLALYALALAGRAEPAYEEKLYAWREKLSTEDRALLALAIAESRGPDDMVGALLRPGSAAQPRDEERFGCAAREQAIRLLAWVEHRPDDRIVDTLVSNLMREQKAAHWGTTQGDAWALLALTDYAWRVEGKLQPADAQLEWGGQSIPFHLDAGTHFFTQSIALSNSPGAMLGLLNASSSRLYTCVSIEARPPETPQPRQDRGFGLQRYYERLDDDNQPQDLRGLRVGDRVLITLRLSVRETARYVVIDDALPAILEAVNPEFKTQEARAAGGAAGANCWTSDFREIRKDRCLSFADWVAPGAYTLRYVARVRAAGAATAPSAKVEEMYHPERCGISETAILTSQAVE